jgi:lipopolysaccharide export system protein LptC
MTPVVRPDAPDTALPLAPLTLRPGAPAPAGRPWGQRVRDAIVGYLPILMMGTLALATWWLVKNTPVPEPQRGEGPVRTDPDYEMRGFSVQRFTREGPATHVIQGERLRHFPVGDLLDIDNVRLLWTDDQGRQTVATATRARAKADGTEVELIGAARVLREAAPEASPPTERFEFRSEYLQVFPEVDLVRTDRPVTVARGASTLQAGGLEYDHRTRTLALKGRVRGSVVGGGTP